MLNLVNLEFENRPLLPPKPQTELNRNITSQKPVWNRFGILQFFGHPSPIVLPDLAFFLRPDGDGHADNFFGGQDDDDDWCHMILVGIMGLTRFQKLEVIPTKSVANTRKKRTMGNLSHPKFFSKRDDDVGGNFKKVRQ